MMSLVQLLCLQTAWVVWWPLAERALSGIYFLISLLGVRPLPVASAMCESTHDFGREGAGGQYFDHSSQQNIP